MNFYNNHWKSKWYFLHKTPHSDHIPIIPSYSECAYSNHILNVAYLNAHSYLNTYSTHIPISYSNLYCLGFTYFLLCNYNNIFLYKFIQYIIYNGDFHIYIYEYLFYILVFFKTLKNLTFFNLFYIRYIHICFRLFTFGCICRLGKDEIKYMHAVR